jgi:GNAT superfamily N-acetyltransferase
MDLTIVSLARRPDLIPIFDDFPDSWPEFMYHDPVSAALFDDLVRRHPESNLIAIDPADPATPVARACAFPFPWTGDPDTSLPPGGYDQVLLTAATRPDGASGEVAAALEVTVRPDARGTGVSARMLDALRRALRDLGYRSLVVPVRPNRKHLYPSEPMTAYLARTRADGLPEDPWLRTHVRAGGRTAGIAPYSMTVIGTPAQWREWTGLPFAGPGPVLVPDALVPVHCDPAADVATYVEPNVWVHHRLVAQSLSVPLKG